MNDRAYLSDIVKPFDGFIDRSPHQFRKMIPIDEWWHDPKSTATDVLNASQVQAIGGVAIHIPDCNVRDFVDAISPRIHAKELELRATVPAVKKAYEHYRMLLLMCGVEDA